MEFKDAKTKDGKGNEIAVSAADLKRAFAAWAGKMEPLSYSTLAHQIEIASQADWSGPWPFARLADRLVQKLRKEGVISLDRGRGWRMTEKGREFLEKIKEERS